VNKDGQTYCSFCGGDRDNRSMLVVGPGDAAICNACVALCQEIIDEGRGQTAALIGGWVFGVQGHDA
jgi:ATP-dependent protease Clp ATPase subunit